MSKEVTSSQQSIKKKAKLIAEKSTEEDILNQIQHLVIGKLQLINQECSTRNEEFDKIITYMGQAIQCLEVIELNQIFREKKNEFSSNSLLQNTQLQDKMDVKITRRFENYMTEIQKKITKFESYEPVIKKCFGQVEELLQEIESQQILTSLLNLKIEEPEPEVKQQEKDDKIKQKSSKESKSESKSSQETKGGSSRRNRDRDEDENDKDKGRRSKKEEKKEKEEIPEEKEDPYFHLKKSINKEIEKLCNLEEDYYLKLDLTNDIKQNFAPFDGEDMSIEYWKTRVGLQV